MGATGNDVAHDQARSLVAAGDAGMVTGATLQAELTISSAGFFACAGAAARWSPETAAGWDCHRCSSATARSPGSRWRPAPSSTPGCCRPGPRPAGRALLKPRPAAPRAEHEPAVASPPSRPGLVMAAGRTDLTSAAPSCACGGWRRAPSPARLAPRPVSTTTPLVPRPPAPLLQCSPRVPPGRRPAGCAVRAWRSSRSRRGVRRGQRRAWMLAVALLAGSPCSTSPRRRRRGVAGLGRGAGPAPRLPG